VAVIVCFRLTQEALTSKPLDAHKTPPLHRPAAFTNVTRFTQRVVNLAPVRRSSRDCRLIGDTARSHLAGVTDVSSRIRDAVHLGGAQTRCSLFIAPCASLFFASRTSLRPRPRNGASRRAGVGRVGMTAVLTILQALCMSCPTCPSLCFQTHRNGFSTAC
jgi:hypothetical protein